MARTTGSRINVGFDPTSENGRVVIAWLRTPAAWRAACRWVAGEWGIVVAQRYVFVHAYRDDLCVHRHDLELYIAHMRVTGEAPE